MYMRFRPGRRPTIGTASAPVTSTGLSTMSGASAAPWAPPAWAKRDADRPIASPASPDPAARPATFRNVRRFQSFMSLLQESHELRSPYFLLDNLEHIRRCPSGAGPHCQQTAVNANRGCQQRVADLP